MNLFTRIKEKRQKVQFAAHSLDRGVLEAMLSYGAQIPLPESSEILEIRLLENLPVDRRGEAPYYLLFFSDRSREGWLNAGYAAGQTAAYMKFQGIAASVLREVPEEMKKKRENGLRCAAVLAFGCQETGSRRSKAASGQEASCIRVERGGQWSEELLEAMKKQGLTGTEFTHMAVRGGQIHFLLKASARKHPQQAAVDAGVLIAGIMAAAEELWIDLELVKQKGITEEGYLMSLCRKGEQREESAERIEIVQVERRMERPALQMLGGSVGGREEVVGISGKEEAQIRYA